MREERYHIALDKYDKNIVAINALNTLRTAVTGGTPHRALLTRLISKVAHAPTRKGRALQVQ